MSRWEIAHFTALEKLYLADCEAGGLPGSEASKPSSGPILEPTLEPTLEGALFGLLAPLVHLAAALAADEPRRPEVARHTASAAYRLARLVFDEAGVDPETAVDLLGRLQEQHLGGWTGKTCCPGTRAAAVAHLLSAFRELTRLGDALGAGSPTRIETHAAHLANFLLALAFEAGVFARPTPPPSTRAPVQPVGEEAG